MWLRPVSRVQEGWRLGVLVLLLGSAYRAFELSRMSLHDLSQLDDDTVQSQLRDCGTFGNEGVWGVKSTCIRLEYVARFMALRNNILLDHLEKPHRLHEVAFVEDTLDYQNIFENFLLKNRPFLSSTEPFDSSILVPTEYPNMFTHDHALRRLSKTKEIYEDAPIPSLLQNSYNFRLRDLPSDASRPFDYDSDWPALINVKDNNSIPIHGCPSRMHQVIWGQNSSLVARLFLKSQAGRLGPEFGNHHEMLHHIKYSTLGFAESPPSDFPKFTEVEIGPSQYLFVPETYLVALGVGKEGGVNALRMCFFDASNLKYFREEMAFESTVSSYAKSILRQVNDGSFDYSMKREPQVFTLRTMQPTSQIDQYTDIDQDQSATLSQEKAKKSRKRKSGGKFKEWQETNKWNTMIATLTLPRPSTPLVVSIGRGNATLTWRSVYNPSIIDKTLFGFNISVCAEPNIKLSGSCREQTFLRDQLTEVSGIEQISSDGSECTLFKVVLQDLHPGTSYKFRSTMLVGTSNSSPSDWTSVYTTSLVTSPATVVGQVLATTQFEDEKPLKLFFNQPVDDGGAPIIWYKVYFRCHNEDVSPTWKIQGKYGTERVTALKSTKWTEAAVSRTLTIDNLLPGFSYDFRVSAVNEMGESTPSPASNVVEISNNHHYFHPSSIIQILGGSVDFVDAAFKTSSQQTLNIVKSEMRVILNDTAQMISSSDGSLRVPVWSSYYSPRRFSVMGPIVHVDSTAELAGQEIYGKIAVMIRDGEPINLKARKTQSAGALGLVVVDSGICEDFNQKCMPGSEKGRGEFFAEIDPVKSWSFIRIPVVLVLNDLNSTAFFRHLGFTGV